MTLETILKISIFLMIVTTLMLSNTKITSFGHKSHDSHSIEKKGGKSPSIVKKGDKSPPSMVKKGDKSPSIIKKGDNTSPLPSPLPVATSPLAVDQPPLGGRSSRFRDAISRDIERYKGINRRVKQNTKKPRHKSSPSSRRLEEEEEIPIELREGPVKSKIKGSVKLPMYAAADYEMGEYVVDMDIGNPPTKLRMVIDTGSDLTWVKCKKDNRGHFKNEKNNVLDVDNSLSYKAITCDSTMCKDEFSSLSSLDICPNVHAPCFYNYSYGEAGLTTYGIFGEDMATLPTTTGEPALLPELLIGCSESYTNGERLKHADGVLGLGIHPYSFALHAVRQFGGSFSYCLVDHLSPTNVTNYLIFGDYKEKAPTQEFMRYTALLVSDIAPY